MGDSSRLLRAAATMRAIRPLVLVWVLVASLPLQAGNAQAPPAGATAQCRDGSYSYSVSRGGTCSHHRGVAQWLTRGQVPARAESVSTAQAPAPQRALTAAEAKDHVGETATVCGVVASARYAASSRGRPTFLNLEQPYPNQLFTVVVWGSARGAFPEAPEVAYRAQRVCVTGVIDTYRGRPQIAAPGPTAIRVMSR